MIIENIPALVTGGGSGLGAETSRQLAKAGAKVAILDVNFAQAEQLAAEIGGLALFCDVTQVDSVQEAIEKAQNTHGVARICVNCAGIAPGKRVIGKNGPMPLEDFRKAIEINLIGSFNVLRLAAASMSHAPQLNEDGERGVIINTASVAAFEGQIGQAAYSASKGGVASMTLPIAREFASLGIRMVTIAPGIMETPMVQGMSPEVQDSLSRQIPFPNRLGKPLEFAKTVLHIVENAYLNGTVIRLDAAVRMQPK